MDIFWISPPEVWWRLLIEKDAVVYINFPIEGTDDRGERSREIHTVLIRGHVVSMRKNRFGATRVRIRVHARCRLYKEDILPSDEVIEVDLSCVVGVDHDGVMLFPRPF